MLSAGRNMLLVQCAVCLFIPLCSAHGHSHTHDHDHDHHDERPSFKYSREANQPTGGHFHDHDHGHDHGHAHHHGHAHDHGHAHGHGHDHDHGHDRDHEHAHDHGHKNDHGHGHAHHHGHAHDHGHAHGHEHAHDHGHTHDHGHAHGHDHAHDHGHVHDHHHGHVHDHGHDHAHDHGHDHDHDHDHGHVHDHGHIHDHEHAHDHDDDHYILSDVEHPSLKYSQETNEAAGDHDYSQEHAYTHDHGHTHDHAHSDADGQTLDDKQKRERRSVVPADSGLMLWAISLGSTALISISPVIVLMLIPLKNAKEQQPLLKVLLSFASGGLLGDAFLHLIPHAIMSQSSSSTDHRHGHSHESHGHSHGGHGHSHDDDHNLTVGLWVLFGIVAFLAVEKFVRYVKGGHSHGHSHGTDSDHSSQSSGKTDKNKTGKKSSETKSSEVVNGDKIQTSHSSQIQASTTTASDGKEDIKVAGYLNLAADFAHNFTDGLAIGASYAAGRSVGIITMVTILLHEVPHEVGDFAILMQSGCSRRKAMMLQFTTAIGALLGTVCSLLAEGIGNVATAWILPFTAGGFIYIATVSVIPELLQDSKIGQSIKEIAALITGLAMMVIIAKYE